MTSKSEVFSGEFSCLGNPTLLLPDQNSLLVMDANHSSTLQTSQKNISYAKVNRNESKSLGTNNILSSASFDRRCDADVMYRDATNILRDNRNILSPAPSSTSKNCVDVQSVRNRLPALPPPSISTKTSSGVSDDHNSSTRSGYTPTSSPKLSITCRTSSACQSCQNSCKYVDEHCQFTNGYSQTSARGEFITGPSSRYFCRPSSSSRRSSSSSRHSAQENQQIRRSERRENGDDLRLTGMHCTDSQHSPSDQSKSSPNLVQSFDSDGYGKQSSPESSKSYLFSLSNTLWGLLSSFVYLYFHRLASLLRRLSSSSSSSIFSLFIIYSLVLPSVLPRSTLAASAYPNAKYSPDSYGLWDRSLVLDDLGHYVVQWTASSTDIQFRLTVRTRGYIGFGLSSQSVMDGADIVVG